MRKLNLGRFSKPLAIFGMFGVLLAGLLIPATAFAATTQSTSCGANLQCVITFGNQAIAKRQADLNTLNAKITADLNAHKITSGQASPLQSDVKTNQTGLAALKTTLDADKTVAAARATVGDIYTQFRIYIVVLPRDYRSLEYDFESNVQATMQAAIPVIQKAIAAAPADKQARLNALFSNYQTKVAAAASALSPLPSDFTQMTPTNYNQNHAAYETTRKAVDSGEHTANLDLHEAARDVHAMAKVVGL